MKKIKITGISPSLDPEGMEIHFSDDSVKIIDYKKLRKNCPCAPCRGSDDAITDEGFKIKGVNWVGNYALGILWADDHSTGIYPFETLYKLGDNKESVVK
jgi:DUF971 family protein